MRIKFSLVVLALTAVSFTACDRHSVYDPKSAGTKALLVPAGFDWDLSENVQFSVTSKVETAVSVYEDEACQTLLATLPATEEAVSYNLNVMKGTEKLFVQYPDADNNLKVLPITLAGTKAGGKGTSVSVQLPEEGTGQGDSEDKKDGIIYYPAKSKGWGSVFFEDMWPELGDYDFNDIAVWYKIQLHTKANAIYISVRLNALGGEHPSQLCLQLDDVKAKYVDVDDLPNNGDGTGKYLLETNGDSPAVISFDWGNKKGIKGGKYYNTESKYRVPVKELNDTQIGIIIYVEDDVRVAGLDLYSFNFFIRKADGTEIHLKGYQPTEAFKEKYEEIVAANEELDPDNFYCSRKGLVWGIKVPASIDHPIEKTDMTKAYKFFGDWVTSNGKNHKNWFEEQSGKDLRINVRK